MRAPHHPEQARRLETLYSYDVLDTPRDADFDEIVELAARICNAPISVVNLIDGDRQWFKAEVGLNARETPLETSLCAHVILQDDFVEIPDTLQDARMADNPLCAGDPGLRFYAGARLIAPNGLPIGTLCVLDKAPRELNDLQREALRVLSRQVMKQLELRRTLKNQAVLMHEADHRVKNSLQTLSSLMRLYRRKVIDPQAVEAFDAVQRRVEAVSALHGELQGSDAGTVAASAFLERIVGLLRDSSPQNVVISCAVDEIELRASAASALGILVSEFVANSIKHGFVGDGGGEVTISLRRVEGATELVCRDNGIGSGAGSAPETSAADRAPQGQNQTLGTNVMAAVASQLNGVLTTDLTPEGSSLTLRF